MNYLQHICKFKLLGSPDISGLKQFYTYLMTMDREKQRKAVENAAAIARKMAD